jgi:hypothetical protein
MIKEIPKSDVVVRPFKVYKEWTLDQNEITTLYATRYEDASLYDADTDELTNGISKRVLFKSIETQFYRTPQTASVLFEVGLRRDYTSEDERKLLPDLELTDDSYNPLTDDDGNPLIVDSNYTDIAVIPIPQRYYGEGVKIGSVTLTDTLKSKTYTDDGNSNLINQTTGEIEGNIFYDRGLIVMHFADESEGQFSQFEVNFRSTMTIYENEIFLSVNENEFNVSQNPTAVYEVDGVKKSLVTSRRDKPLYSNQYTTSSVYQSGVKYIRNKDYPYVSQIDSTQVGSFDDYFNSGSVDPTGSYLAPYITTIGLYDDNLNMVAVGKLPRPIKSLPDYPLNFIVRFDT